MTLDEIEKALFEKNILEGILFDDKKVYIDVEATQVGGSWQGDIINGMPSAWDSNAIKFFYEESLKIENPTILDIGANTGSFSLIPIFNENAKIYSFEPMPRVFNILNRNIEINNLQEKVKCFQIALSNKNGKSTLKYPATNRDSGLAVIGTPLRFNQWHEVKVQTLTLDEFAKRKNINTVDMIKIDTEGCELFVLKGGEALIKENFPNILLEYNEQNTRQFDYEPSEILELLTSWGYKKYNKVGSEDYYFYSPKKKIFTFDSNISNKSNDGKITLFAVPKAFKGHAGVIQRNAIKSWTKLKSKPNIVLIGNDEGTKEIAEELNLLHIPNVKCNKLGTPLVNSIFELGENAFDTNFYCYINADIILLDDFDKAIENLSKNTSNIDIDKFLLTAQRANIDIKEEINFDEPEWKEKLNERILKEGVFDFKSAIDIFLYTKGLFYEIPDFAIGRCYWDHWLMWKAKNRDGFIIDASPSFTITHQIHDYSHAKKGFEEIWFGEEAIENERICEKRFLTIDSSTHILNKDGEILISNALADTRPSRKETAYKYFKRGAEELFKNNFQVAFDYIQYGLDVYVSIYQENISPNIYLLKALSLIGLKRFDEAKEAIITEIKIYKDNFYAKELLYYFIKNPEKLEDYKFYNIDVQNLISSEDFFIDKSKLAILEEIENINNPKIIELAVKSLFEEYPNNINVLKLYAKNKYNLGNKLEAKFIYSKIIQHFLDDEELLKTYSNLLFETANYVEALEYFKKASKKNTLIKTNDYIKNKLENRKKNSKYLVSIIINLYKYKKTINKKYSDALLDFLNNLKSQSIFESLEIIIVDSDLEQDKNQDFEKYLSKYPNAKYIQFKNQDNLFEIFNRGIKLSTAKYIMEMELVPAMYPETTFIEEMLTSLENNEDVSIAYSHFNLLTSEKSKYPLQSFEFERNILLFDSENCVMSPILMWKRDIHDEYDYYNTSLENPEFEFWLRILQTNKSIKVLDKSKYTYVVKKVSVKNRKDITLENIKYKRVDNIDTDILKLYQDNFNKSVINRKNDIEKLEIKKQKFDVNFFIENNLFKKKENDEYYILAQDWKYYSLPRKWVNKINRKVEQVWVSSKFIKESYVNSGIYPNKIKVIPTHINPKPANIKAFEIDTKKNFKFLYIGDLSKENGLDLLLDAYTKEFSNNDDVCLIIKDSFENLKNDYKEIKEKISLLLGNKNIAEIIFYEKEFSEENILGLINACNCFVYPFRTDASVNNILQVATSNIPIITSNGGSVLDFCNEKNSFLINTELQETNINELEVFKLVDNIYNFEPNFEHLKELMKTVFNNRETAKEKAIKLRKYVEDNYSFEKIYSLVKNSIKELSGKPILRFNLDKVIENLKDKGLNYIKQEKYEGAERAFFELVHYENTSDNFYYLGVSQFKQKKFDESIDAFLNYIDLDDYNSEICEYLKTAFLNIGDYESAEFFRNKLLKFTK